MNEIKGLKTIAEQFIADEKRRLKNLTDSIEKIRAKRQEQTGKPYRSS